MAHQHTRTPSTKITLTALAAMALAMFTTTTHAVLSEDFESGLGGFTFDNDFGSGNGLWHLSTGREADGLPDHSSPFSLYYGQNEGPLGGGNFNTPVLANGGAVFSPVISLPSTGTLELNFNYLLESEFGTTFDAASVAVDAGGGFVTIMSKADVLTQTAGLWSNASADLTSFSGQDITLRFSFDTGDGVNNNLEGWYIDDVTVLDVNGMHSGAVPEPLPATLGLMGLGVLSMATRRRAA